MERVADQLPREGRAEKQKDRQHHPMIVAGQDCVWTWFTEGPGCSIGRHRHHRPRGHVAKLARDELNRPGAEVVDGARHHSTKIVFFTFGCDCNEAVGFVKEVRQVLVARKFPLLGMQSGMTKSGLSD